jgi:hypothetical protein
MGACRPLPSRPSPSGGKRQPCSRYAPARTQPGVFQPLTANPAHRRLASRLHAQPINHGGQYERDKPVGIRCAAVGDGKKNSDQKLNRRTAHLPDTMEDAVGFFRALIARHHEAMLAAEMATVMAMREEAALLALRLNYGEPGIIANEKAPGSVLRARTAAEDGTIPIWGQSGAFTVTACGMQVRLEIDGMFGIGATFMYWPGLSAHALDRDKPFLSETDYRSFLGVGADEKPF